MGRQAQGLPLNMYTRILLLLLLLPIFQLFDQRRYILYSNTKVVKNFDEKMQHTGRAP